MKINTNLAPLDGFFGNLLDGLFNRVNSTIQKAIDEATTAGIELEIDAGKEIDLAIQNVKNAYKDDLNYTIDKVGKAAQGAFNQLDSMVQQFEQQVGSEMNTLMVQAQQLVNSLPFSSKQPQLTSLQPRYLVIDSLATSSLVTVKGNFPASAKTGFTPSLTFGNTPCSLVDSSTKSFTFQVPHQIFSDAQQNRYSFTTGNLQVPWDNGWWFLSHKTEFDYKVGLGALPQVAGQGSVTYRSTETIPPAASLPHTSCQHQTNNNPDTVLAEFFPDADWAIDVTQQVVLHTQLNHKDENPGLTEIVSIAPDKIVVKIFPKPGGVLTTWVDFHEFPPATVKVNDRVENFEMNWKDAKLLQPQGDEAIYQVNFTNYAEHVEPFAAPEVGSQNTLQIIAESGGVWKIWAQPPIDLTLTMEQVPAQVREKLVLLQQLDHLRTLANVPKELRIVPAGLVSLANRTVVEHKLSSTQTESSSATYSYQLGKEVQKLSEEIESFGSQESTLLDDVNKLKEALSQQKIDEKTAKSQLQELKASLNISSLLTLAEKELNSN